MNVGEQSSLMLFELELRTHALEQWSEQHSVRYEFEEGVNSPEPFRIQCRIFSKYAGEPEFRRLTETEKSEYFNDWIDLEWSYLLEQKERFTRRKFPIPIFVCHFEILADAGMSSMTIFSQVKSMNDV